MLQDEVSVSFGTILLYNKQGTEWQMMLFSVHVWSAWNPILVESLSPTGSKLIHSCTQSNTKGTKHAVFHAIWA